jgi:protoporphyrinogen oxidase
MKSGPIVVLGAGCAGLAATRRLVRAGRPVVVLEREDHVGGLAGGVHLGDNVYEYGPHAFHTTDPEILGDIQSIMGRDLITYRRTIKIKFLGNYFTFPLTLADVLGKLPPTTVVRAGLSLVRNVLAGLVRKPPVENSETVLQRYYGDVLYRIFFKSYIEHVWGIGPSEFSPAFARERIPRLSLLDVWDRVAGRVRALLGPRRVRTEGYVEKVEGNLYTTAKGFWLITQRMAEAAQRDGAEVVLDATVRAIERQGERATAVRFVVAGLERRIACSAVVNTLPVNEAVLMTEPALEEPVRGAARALRFRALVFVGLLVRRPRVLQASFMYFREHSFNRISDLSQFGFKVEPEGCTLLVAEISCDPEDRPWTDDEHARSLVLEDLVREGLVERGEVIESHVFRARHAYPIYTLGYEQELERLLEWFAASSNLETAGRQGRFQYVNTHVAMKMGYEAAERLLAKLGAREPEEAPVPPARAASGGER